MTRIEAPAVHVDQWKHWSFAEGRQRALRFVPEGCGVYVRDADTMQFEELRTKRIFDLPPRPPDAQAWWEANRAQLQPARSSAQPRSGGPWTLAGNLYQWSLGYAPPQHVTYMASFFGVSQVATTNKVSLSVWPGLQPSGGAGTVVLQPVLVRSHPAPVNQWYLVPTINGGGHQLVSGQFPIIMPQGVWGVIRELGDPLRWLIGFYRGNRGNTGPALGAPVTGCTPLYIYFNDNFWGSLVSPRGGMRNPQATIEIPNGEGFPADGTYDCGDLNIQAVFGGITLTQGPNKLPVQWVRGSNLGAFPPKNITCSTSESIQNATSNGSTQLMVQYGG